MDNEPEKKSRKKPNWKPRDQWRKYERHGNGALLVEEELATALGEAPRTIRTWRHDGIIPAIILGHRSIPIPARRGIDRATKTRGRRMNAHDPPLKTKRAGDLAATSPNCFGLADDSAIVCGSQTFCEHQNTRIEQLASGPHFAKEVCCDCDRVLRWLPKPVTVERCRLNGLRLVRLGMCRRLSTWERAFVHSVSQQRKLSPKQQQIVDRLAATYLETAK
jgi:hypothetical protein